jgi:hypothetical protein
MLSVLWNPDLEKSVPIKPPNGLVFLVVSPADYCGGLFFR